MIVERQAGLLEGRRRPPPEQNCEYYASYPPILDDLDQGEAQVPQPQCYVPAADLTAMRVVDVVRDGLAGRKPEIRPPGRLRPLPQPRPPVSLPILPPVLP